MKNLLIIILLGLFSTHLSARTGTTILPPKDSKVYVASTNDATIPYAYRSLSKWGYWQATDSKATADYVITYNIRRSWLPSFLSTNLHGYVQISDAKTGVVLFTSRNANSYLSWVPNHKKSIIKKLNRRIEKNME